MPTGSPSSRLTIRSRRRWPGKPGVGLIPATDRNRFKAVEFLAKVESRGGTEIAAAARPGRRAARRAGHDRDRILVLVTDGQVGNEDQVLQVLGRA